MDFVAGASVFLPFDVEDLLEVGLLKLFMLVGIVQGIFYSNMKKQ